MTDMVRAAVFNGEIFVKFISGEARQVNANMTAVGLDWRVVAPTTITAGAVGARDSLPVHENREILQE